MKYRIIRGRNGLYYPQRSIRLFNMYLWFTEFTYDSQDGFECNVYKKSEQEAIDYIQHYCDQYKPIPEYKPRIIECTRN